MRLNISVVRIFKWEGINIFLVRLGKKCFESTHITPPPSKNLKMYFQHFKIVLIIFIKT
jgi:hypothetical protein